MDLLHEIYNILWLGLPQNWHATKQFRYLKPGKKDKTPVLKIYIETPNNTDRSLCLVHLENQQKIKIFAPDITSEEVKKVAKTIHDTLPFPFELVPFQF